MTSSCLHKTERYLLEGLQASWRCLHRPEDNLDFTLSLISCHSLSSPKRLVRFLMDQSLFGSVHNYSLKKSLFTSDSLAQLIFFIQSSLFCRAWPKIFQVQLFKTLRKKSDFYFEPDWISLVMDWSNFSVWNMIGQLKYYQPFARANILYIGIASDTMFSVFAKCYLISLPVQNNIG